MYTEKSLAVDFNQQILFYLIFRHYFGGNLGFFYGYFFSVDYKNIRSIVTLKLIYEKFVNWLVFILNIMRYLNSDNFCRYLRKDKSGSAILILPNCNN